MTHQTVHRHFHTVWVTGISFTVERVYQPTRLLGQGAYGTVCAALEKGGHEVAIKKVAGAFDETRARIGHAKRTLRELQLLRQLHHENIISIEHLMVAPGGTDAYIVTELMDSDLGKVPPTN